MKLDAIRAPSGGMPLLIAIVFFEKNRSPAESFEKSIFHHFCVSRIQVKATPD
ncbi:MAG: hypothetical protein ACPL5I_10180 [Thermodesulfobacteriota bacterium]